MDTIVPVKKSKTNTDASGKTSADAKAESGHEIPRWRRIEILRERAELREALGDDLDDFEELEREVFGSDEEYRAFYRLHDSEDDEEEPDEDADDDGDFEDDDFEDFDED